MTSWSWDKSSGNWNDNKNTSGSWNDTKSTSWSEPTTDWQPPKWQPEQAGGATLPADFVQTSSFLDSRVIFGSQMYRQVQSTPWSRKAGLAGKDMQQITIADVSYRGWNEGSLRYLSAGKYVGVVWTKSVAENVFCNQITSMLRTSDLRIDDLVVECWRQEHPDQPVPDKIHDPAQFMKPLVDRVILTLQQYQPAKTAQPPDLRIQELEAELQALNKTSTGATRTQATSAQSSSFNLNSHQESATRSLLLSLTKDISRC